MVWRPRRNCINTVTIISDVEKTEANSRNQNSVVTSLCLVQRECHFCVLDSRRPICDCLNIKLYLVRITYHTYKKPNHRGITITSYACYRGNATTYFNTLFRLGIAILDCFCCDVNNMNLSKQIIFCNYTEEGLKSTGSNFNHIIISHQGDDNGAISSSKTTVSI